MAGAFSSAFSNAFDVAAGAFTLTASVGSFTLTGQTVGLLAARKITAGQASFTLTGESVTLTYTPVTPAAAGFASPIALGVLGRMTSGVMVPPSLAGAGADSGGTTYHGDRNVVRQRYENQKGLALLLTLVTDF